MKNFFLTALGAYVAYGMYRCFTSADGEGYLPADCPVISGVPNLPAHCQKAPACSNRTAECVLKWPLWNATKCNTHF